MNRSFRPDGLPTLIGSLPCTSHQAALDLIFQYTPQVPLWPQLPANPAESMLSQFIEGFPGVVEGEHTYCNRAAPEFDEEFLHFFEEYLAITEAPEQLTGSRFALSRERAAGIYQLAERIPPGGNTAAVKGQITGPFTMLTGLVDQDHKLGYYDPSIREMVVKGLCLKAAWQVRFLQSHNLPVLLFIDEPALAGLGSSAFISIAQEDVGRDLNETIETIQANGGLAGIHVCANTDWNFLLSLKLNILSFDAFDFFDRLITCREQLYSFLQRDGIIAWGIIPTSRVEDITAATADTLVARWEDQAATLENAVWDRRKLLSRTLITPSCGTGSLPLESAVKVLTLTRDVSRILREKYL